jgi:hypothetical protein
MDDFLGDQLKKIKECIRTTQILAYDSEYIQMMNLLVRIKEFQLMLDIWNEDENTEDTDNGKQSD